MSCIQARIFMLTLLLCFRKIVDTPKNCLKNAFGTSKWMDGGVIYTGKEYLYSRKNHSLYTKEIIAQ